MPDCLSLCCLSGGQEDGGRWAGLTNDVHIEWKMLTAPTHNTEYFVNWQRRVYFRAHLSWDSST